jgi:hypothetical protein
MDVQVEKRRGPRCVAVACAALAMWLSAPLQAKADPCSLHPVEAPALLSPAPEGHDSPSFLLGVRPRVAREATAALATVAGLVARHRLSEIVEDEFERFDRFYHLVHWRERARLTAATDRARHRRARGTWCVEQRINEAEILLQYSAVHSDIRSAIARVAEADASGAYPSPVQAPDGSWGPCRSEWFAKLDDSVDALGLLAEQEPHARPRLETLDFLAEVDTPGKLLAMLNTLQVSEIANSGVYRRPALGSVQSGIAQLVYKRKLRAIASRNGATFLDDPDYCRALTSFMDDMQDPATGFWGPTVATRGRFVKLADLSLTFHALSYRKGDANHLPEIAATTLAIRDLPYPYGWAYRGAVNAHNAYDVAKIFELTWSKMDQEQREAARGALADLLAWVLSPASIAADGSIVGDESFYTSQGAALYFTVAFLAEVGFLRPPGSRDPTFWTDRDFSDGPATCRRLRDAASRLDEDTPQLAASRVRLAALCP